MKRQASWRAEGKLEQYAGPPHSVVWDFGAVHLRSGAGPQGPPGPHAHFALQLTVGICAAVSFRTGRSAREQTAPGWLVGSDQPHWMNSEGVGVTIFLDPLGDGARRMTATAAGVRACPVAGEKCERICREFEATWRNGWSVAEVHAATERIVEMLAPSTVVLDPLDARVRAVVERLRQDSSENVALREFAAKVGLSESRLAHLFRQAVGIPMREYRLFLRMFQAVNSIAGGSSLTEAAHQAGFSDSAHFCRICRRMYGSAPSDLPEFEADERSRQTQE